jgi:hypothetical protein
VLLHERNEFLGCPALGLEVIVVRGRSASVHLPWSDRIVGSSLSQPYHEVDG